jgi:thiol-disulfide isomerase/thioredoxin
MQSEAVRALVLIALVTVILTMAGCTSKTDVPADAKMAGIESALRSGPVFVEFGADWCSWCDAEKLVVNNLSANFNGVTFLNIDTDENPRLADDFYVEGVPQMNIIVRKNGDGSYLYVNPGGKTTTDRYASRLIGYREFDELETLIEAAIAAR